MKTLQKIKNKNSHNFFYINPNNLCNYKNIISIYSFGFHEVNNLPSSAKKPGIEVMMKRGTYYDIIDRMGLDSFTNRYEDPTEILSSRNIANSLIEKFLDEYLLKYESGSRDYQHNLVDIINSCKSPQSVFELHILGEKNAYWAPLSLNLHDAIDAGINVDIDPICATKRLAAYAKDTNLKDMMVYNLKEADLL